MGGPGSGRKPGFHNGGVPYEHNPVKQGHDPTNVDAQVNRRNIAFAKEIYDLDPVDLGDADAVRERFFDYLDMCDRYEVKPLVSGLANAYGINRGQLLRVAQGDEHVLVRRLTPESRAALQKSYELFEQLWEGNLVAEKGNPVKWIVLGKNNFGYKDQTETVITRREEPTTGLNPAEVAARYAEIAGRQPDALPAEDVRVEGEKPSEEDAEEGPDDDEAA